MYLSDQVFKFTRPPWNMFSSYKVFVNKNKGKSGLKYRVQSECICFEKTCAGALWDTESPKRSMCFIRSMRRSFKKHTVGTISYLLTSVLIFILGPEI